MATTSLNFSEVFGLLQELRRNAVGFYSNKPEMLQYLADRSHDAVDFLSLGLSALAALQACDEADAEEVKRSAWLTRNVADLINAFAALGHDLDVSLADRDDGDPDGGDEDELPPRLPDDESRLSTTLTLH